MTRTVSRRNRRVVNVALSRYDKFNLELSYLNPILDCIAGQLRIARQPEQYNEGVYLRIAAYFTQIDNRRQEIMRLLQVGACGECGSEETEEMLMNPRDDNFHKHCRECEAVSEIT